MRVRGAPGLGVLRDGYGGKGKFTVRVREYEMGNTLQVAILSNLATLAGYDSRHIFATEIDDAPDDLVTKARGNPIGILLGRAAEDFGRNEGAGGVVAKTTRRRNIYRQPRPQIRCLRAACGSVSPVQRLATDGV